LQSNRNAIGQIGRWNDVPWTYVERSVRKMQEKIFQATQRQEWRKVRNLQKLLVRSSKVLLLAIRRVTQENAGKYTPGVDGKVYVTDEDRWTLFKTGNFEIGLGYKPLPGKRVYIRRKGIIYIRPIAAGRTRTFLFTDMLMTLSSLHRRRR
jgi:RNA-directed DNA polymerase